ncbi:MAG: peptidoglycan DD-metalloendopeptidase family protein [Bdellovibrionales bacterium]|nr:peptidoglycan DD-metalloendopeptidase family protein [Bdellovibrionales bacterium]
MRKKAWVGLLFGIQISIPGGECYAVNAQADIVNEQIANSQKKLEIKEQQARQIVSNLFKVQMRMRTVVRKKSSLVHEKFNLERNAEKIKETIQLKENLVAEQKTYLKKRIRALLSFKGQSLMQAIFSAQSPNKIGLNLRILGALATKDQRTLKEYSVSVKEIRVQQINLSHRITQIQAVEKNLDQQERLFLGEQAKRRSILSEIHQEKKITLAKIEELRQASRNSKMDDSGVLDMLYRPSFLDQKGKLAWPVSGAVRTSFGRGAGDEQSRRLFSKGVFLSASIGAPVRAVFDGKVVFSGEIDGLGSTLVLDHGDHFYTVYSYVEQPAVKAESRVQAHQKIAVAGEDRIANRAGIYFEVRHFSEPSDPKTWMKGIL